MKTINKFYIWSWIIALLLMISYVSCYLNNPNQNIVLKEQWSFAVWWTTISASWTFDPIAQWAYNPAWPNSSGQTLHWDHAYVFYQVPEKAKKLPLVFWHWYGQTSKTWETTPDGREWFQNIFLKRNYSVYLLDQPRRWKALHSTVELNIPVQQEDQLWFGIFRLWAWPDFYENVSFSRNPEALNQFFRQSVSAPWSFDMNVNVSAVSELFNKIWKWILVTHSASWISGWLTAIQNKNVKAIIAYEPGSFAFPEWIDFKKYADAEWISAPRWSTSMEDFKKLTQIPIVIYYWDNIPEEVTWNPWKDQWRWMYKNAKIFAKVINDNGWDAKVVHLPDVWIYGNTHFPFSDLNNLEVADELSKWLKEKWLDK